VFSKECELDGSSPGGGLKDCCDVFRGWKTYDESKYVREAGETEKTNPKIASL
jgi:hypothetical protein